MSTWRGACSAAVPILPGDARRPESAAGIQRSEEAERVLARARRPEVLGTRVAVIDHAIRGRIAEALRARLEPLADILAGWEGGSAAFGALDAYSDIDLNFLVVDGAELPALYGLAEESLATVSPIVVSHSVPPGRYYKLEDGGEFLFVDLCFFHVGAPEHNLEIERHGHARKLFDKADWLRPRPVDDGALASSRRKRYAALESWFPVSQSFVRKAILRGQHAEALAAFWSYTLRPLIEILRMRHCPVRWDFGMRYLDRDLPPAVHERLRDLMFVQSLDDLGRKLDQASAWGCSVLEELQDSQRES